MRLFAALLVLAAPTYAALSLPEGLKVDVTLEKTCTRPTRRGDEVLMHYTGKLENGKEFDSSWKRGDPLAFKLGAGRVIQGWDLGLLEMCIGEERTLTIPPKYAYGKSGMPPVIPGDATLIFQTKLMGIAGVDADEPVNPDTPTPAEEAELLKELGSLPTSTATAALQASDSRPASEGSAKGPADRSQEQGECHLLGPFALFVQGALGVLALFSLVWKRWRERPQRPVRVWFFDASKQVFGSAMLHVFNVAVSMLSAGDVAIASTMKDTTGHRTPNHRPNPCSWYLINIAVDTTIGIPILVLILKVLNFAAAHSPLANPVESVKSGHYGQPPKASWWFKQAMIYFIGLLLMKICILGIFNLLPWIVDVGEWALQWTEGSQVLQITFVMLIFPLIMNAIQYYIIDHFIKNKDHAESDKGSQSATMEPDEDESRQRLRDPDEFDDDDIDAPPRLRDEEDALITSSAGHAKIVDGSKTKNS